MRAQQKSRGFTLIELAIVLAIVGLLLAGGVNLLSTTTDTAKYKESQQSLTDIKDTLLGYYITNKRLPCPDTDGDGIENPPVVTGVCTSPRGFLPHVTLGVGGNGDAWGERIKYLVSQDSNYFFTKTASDCGYTRPNLPINSIRIQDLNTVATNYVGDFAGFALVSTGKNGRETNSGMTGAFTNDGGCLGLDVREQENCNVNSVLRSGTQMSDGKTIVFDDMVTWVGDMQLVSELRKAGVCTVSSNNNNTGNNNTGNNNTGNNNTGNNNTGNNNTGNNNTGNNNTGNNESGNNESDHHSNDNENNQNVAGGGDTSFCSGSASREMKCRQGCSGYLSYCDHHDDDHHDDH